MLERGNMSLMTTTTYLLVHGAWGGSWCWRDLAAQFEQRGLPWAAVELPSSRFGADVATDLSDDAAAVVALSQRFESVVIVAHSYGGAVAIEAADAIVNLERIVYIAALVPKPGASATATSREVPVRTLLDESMEVDCGYLRLNRERAALALYNSCSPEVTSWATERLSTQTITSFRANRTSTDRHVPTLYVKCSLDRAVDPKLQDLMATRCGETITLISDHSPMLSQPLLLCDSLLGWCNLNP